MNIWNYVSYEDLKLYLKIATTVTGDDELLEDFCRAASEMWDATTGRRFGPWRETRYYDYMDERGDYLQFSARQRLAYGTEPWASVLKVDEDLLEVKTLQTANGDTTISADDYYLKCGRSYNITPYDRIELKTDGDTTVFTFSGSYQRANIVDGIWGNHNDWANAWANSKDSVQDATGINATVTSITVSDADGADVYGNTPRFKVGQLLKIGDEYLYLVAKNTTSNVLTVIRGVNGTTAATHDKDTAIYIYQPMRDVWHAVRRLAAWLYGQKDSPYMDRQVNARTGVITIPDAAPVDVHRKALYYTRR